MVSSQTQISVTAGKSHKHFATLQRDDIPADQACGGGDGATSRRANSLCRDFPSPFAALGTRCLLPLEGRLHEGNFFFFFSVWISAWSQYQEGAWHVVGFQ